MVEELKEKVSVINDLLNEFNSGDLLFLSHLSDSFEELHTYFEKIKILDQLNNKIIELLDKKIKEDLYSPISIEIITAFEYLQNSLDYLKETKAGKIKASFPEILISSINNYVSDKTGSSNATIKKKAKSEKTLPEAKEEDVLDIDTLQSNFYITFSSEAKSRLLKAQEDILELDADYENNKDKVNDLFRCFHTIKGETGFINLKKIGELSHNMESLLDMLRKEETSYHPEFAGILLEALDTIMELINYLDNEKWDEYSAVDTHELNSRILDQIDKERPLIGKILRDEGKISEKDFNELKEKQKETNYEVKLGELAVQENKVKKTDLEETLKKQATLKSAEKQKSEKEAYINVAMSQISDLNDLVQELWIAENQLEDSKIQKIRKITKDIQGIAMRLRTVKLNPLFIKLRRLVYDLSKKLNKQINLISRGEDLEIDRDLAKALEEPLVHIIRNSIDHGIEDKDVRIKNNKKEIASIVVNAERRGNKIVITVRDDGQGIDVEKIRQKAVSIGMISENDTGLSENQILSLIMKPGFSTAEKVSNISGRGVGMDIVNSVVHRFRGKYEISTEKGVYSQVDLIFPLNTAIINGMVIKAGDYYFVLPINDIVECLQIREDLVSTVKNEVQLINVRGENVPLINIESLIDLEFSAANEKKKVAIIVILDKEKYAFGVDEIIDKTEVVIKPLGEKFNELKGISSATIFSGGRIGYILDVEELIGNTKIEKGMAG